MSREKIEHIANTIKLMDLPGNPPFENEFLKSVK